MSDKTIGLVVDATYLYSAKDLIGSNINYNHLADTVREMGSVRHAACHVKANHGQRGFLAALKSQGFEVLSRSHNNDSPEWLSDVAESIMNIAKYVDHLVLAVGDSRYAPIIEWAANTWGCQITLMGFHSTMGEEIQDLVGADGLANLLEIDESFAYAAKQQHAD